MRIAAPPSALALLIPCCLAPAAAHAQDTPAEPTSADAAATAPPARALPPDTWTFTPRIGTYFEADLEGGADVNVDRVGGRAEYSHWVSPKLRLTGRVDAESSSYDWGSFNLLLPGVTSPGDDFYSAELNASGLYLVDQQWGVIAGLGIRADGTGGTDLGEAFTLGGLVAARYQINERLAVSGGVLVRERLEDDLLIVPSIGVEWTINDSLDLAVGARGLDVELSYHPDDTDWRLFVNAAVEAREYRLDENGPIPSGVLRDWKLPLTAGVEWQFADGMFLTAFGGISLSENITIDDQNGNELIDVDRDGEFSGVVGLRGGFRF